MILLLITLNSKIKSSIATENNNILVKIIYFIVITSLLPDHSDIYQ